MSFSVLLQQNEAEVIDMFDYFFSQEYTAHCLMKEAREEGARKEREESIRILIKSFRDAGHNREEICRQLKISYDLSDEKVEKYMDRYWKV